MGMSDSVARSKQISEIAFFVLILAVLLAVYSSTLFYTYILTDETWLILPRTFLYSIQARWSLPMGRPMFAAISWISGEIFRDVGLGVVYFMRLSAIIGLAVAAFYLMRWFEIWGHNRVTSCFTAITVMTLPSFQIVVADGTQLAFAILSTVLACHAFHKGFYTRSTLWIIVSALLLLFSLITYQQQALIFFAMLSVPLLQRSNEQRPYVFVILGETFVTAVSTAYFLGWRFLYRIFWPSLIDHRYGPDAVGVPTIDQLYQFLGTRLVQAANLWDVNLPQKGLITTTVVILILVKVVSDVRRTPRTAPLIYILLASILVASDSFRLVAGAYPSYTTMTALSMVIFYWLFSGITVLAPTPYIAIVITTIGAISAFTTVRDDIAYPNWWHMQQIRTAMISNPGVNAFHIVGGRGGPAYQEFGWRNADRDVYLYRTAVDIADDLKINGKISPERRDKMYISVSGTFAISSPTSIPSAPKPDAIRIVLKTSSLGG